MIVNALRGVAARGSSMIGIGSVGRLLREIGQDVASARERDPAARRLGGLEILLGYQGVHAILAHRALHAIHRAGVPIVPRVLANASRMVTGIEIHPAATIGENLFIDHGMGVVIGETATIGDNVTLYQGVTLGGTGFKGGKRHPTVEDNVTVGSGANLLGPIRVGHGAKIGAGSVVIHDVPPNSTVVGNPGHPVRVEGRRLEGPDADWVHLPDPVADALKGLSDRIGKLESTAPVPRKRGLGRAQRVAERLTGSPKEPPRQPLKPRFGPDPTGG